jgi:transposase-like protein
MMVHLARERTIFLCYQFFEQLRDIYRRKPVFTDDALWYDRACRWLMRLKHQVYDTELKNIMERFIHQNMKERTDECFDDHFPCRKKKSCDRKHVWNWLELFMLYLRTRMNKRRKFTTFLARIGG